ncbi:HAD family hydrolase [Desulforhabdus sp. TSK]|uniref:HAD family hydrolase n=1 Tax=Desulforhabdus sp. TSK TaxID=2925014 RepID=UPI001FC7CA51|nr:HAD family hydrolase [Desulforhabdus sp. TSK]GKT07242.1 haloacid dehalogenase [Desulforhabdus sp. TSK]
MPQNRVIFFDLGHTLVTGSDQSARRILGARLRLTEKETKQVGKLIMTHGAEDPVHLLPPLQALLPHHHVAQLSAVLESVWHEQQESVREIPEAVNVLKRLRAAGYRLGALSNTWHPFYKGICEKCPELNGLFHYHILSYRKGMKKPSPRIFQEALMMAGEEPPSCWMVGDTYELDMEPAFKVGMQTLWVLHRPERERPLLAEILQGRKPGPHWAVEALDGVLDFFLEKGQ